MSVSAAPFVSIAIPLRNEESNIGPLLAEIEAALSPLGAFEVVVVNDGSTDKTFEILRGLKAEKPWLRVLSHAKSSGQSAAVRSAVRACSAPLVATLDGDGQNNPAFLPALLKPLQDNAALGLVAGQRVGRKDTGFKRWQSKIANKIRGGILKDGTRDSGCGLKAFRRDVYLSLPYFDALHRFMPALVAREGWGIAHVDVIDRPRMSGVSNYGFFDRLWVGIQDLAGVWWLIRRKRSNPKAEELF